MTPFSESTVEAAALEWLGALGWTIADARLVVWNGNPRRNREPEVQHDIQHGDGAGTAG